MGVSLEIRRLFEDQLHSTLNTLAHYCLIILLTEVDEFRLPGLLYQV